MDNQAKLMRLFSDLFGVDPATLNDSSSPDTIPTWDSLGMVNLVAELEQVFEVRFDILEVQDFKTVGIIKSVLVEKGIAFSN